MEYIIFRSVNYKSIVAGIIFEVFCNFLPENQFREIRGEGLCYESKYFKQLLWMLVSFPGVFKQTQRNCSCEYFFCCFISPSENYMKGNKYVRGLKQLLIRNFS